MAIVLDEGHQERAEREIETVEVSSADGADERVAGECQRIDGARHLGMRQPQRSVVGDAAIVGDGAAAADLGQRPHCSRSVVIGHDGDHPGVAVSQLDGVARRLGIAQCSPGVSEDPVDPVDDVEHDAQSRHPGMVSSAEQGRICAADRHPTWGPDQ